VHNNYFFLEKIVEELTGKVLGFTFGEIFSQNKDELIIACYHADEEFYIKAHLTSAICCLAFPDDFKRARKNSVDLFPGLIGKSIEKVTMVPWDRSFYISTDTYHLLFKLHGNRSNILLFEGNQCKQIFKQKIEEDLAITFDQLSKNLDMSYEKFMALNGNLRQFIPVLGKEASSIVQEKPTLDEQWSILQGLLREIKDEIIYVTRESLPKLLLFKPRHAEYSVYKQAMKASTDFFHQYIQLYHFQRMQNATIKRLEDQIKKTKNYIQKNKNKLDELRSKKQYNHIADIIMANIHQISGGSSKVKLFDFYNQEDIEIPLKRHLTPQKNAEQYYRKAKNQKIEIGQLEENIKTKQGALKKMEDELSAVLEASDAKSLKKLERTSKPANVMPDRPYHTFQYDGFDILVGKNAKKNDELTFKTAHKNDLWLHAKDARGAHVVIRHKAGYTIPEHVIEKAASLAAWFSKRSSESYVPVSYTPRKFIRKTKDLAAGQVIVEKEQVLLVPPENWTLKKSKH